MSEQENEKKENQEEIQDNKVDIPKEKPKRKSTLEKKSEMQDRIKKMQKEMKGLEEKAQIELGKYLIKEWEIKDSNDSEQVLEVIKTLKEDAKELLNNSDRDMGKSDM